MRKLKLLFKVKEKSMTIPIILITILMFAFTVVGTM